MFRGFGDEELTKQRIRRGTVRRILPYARPYRWSILALLVLTVLDAAAAAAGPFLLKVIIDKGVLPRNTGLVVAVASAVAGLAVFEALVVLVQRWFSARVGEGLIYDLRVKVFAHVQRQPLAFFTRAQTGSLVSRLNSDVIEAQQAVTSILSQVLSSVLSVVLVLGAMFYLSWQVTLASLVLLPLFVVLTRVVGRRLQRLTRESMQLNAEMGSMMNERFNVAGAMLVKLYGRPAEETRMFAARSGRVRDINIVAGVYGRVLFVALTLLAALGTALTYGLGGALVVHGAFQIGSMVALATLLTRLYGPITSLANVQVSVMTALVSFDRVFEVLDLEPVVAERPDAVTLEVSRDPAPDIEFEGVSFRYPAPNEVSLASLESIALPAGERVGPSAQVLDEVTFRAPAGGLTALVGPTGAGKTTVTHLVSRLYDPTSGTVRIGGRDLREATLDSLRDTVGVVTQDAHMFHDTIRANLLYARPDATDEELAEACRAAQIWDLIESFPHGLDTVVGDRGYRLSGGEKQRVSLARLLLKAPPIVVLDEATAHLDSESEAAVQRALAAALRGRTSLVIAHRLSTVREADQILVVDGGRIAERGTHEELIERGGLYAELYRTQYAGQANGRATAPPERPMAPRDREPGPGDLGPGNAGHGFGGPGHAGHAPGEKFFIRRQV
ncbi:ABC transporter ATP-binding protein [Actinomadura oligospora]|uniref:ABC transporter ATP-binding protein n=1 Tax=Actinomadura oligospora TaxID=111804 RepID=UPI00054CEBAB|nr:ABC transporter ATP-binding protein [Actinomadura oligospora]